MNAEYDTHTLGLEAGHFKALDAEARLERNRARLSQRLTDIEETPHPVAEWVDTVTPVVAETVRQHPYASLSGAAVVGVLLVRWFPWGGLGGSLLAGLFARQLVSRSLASGGQVIGRMLHTHLTRPPLPPR